MKLASENNAVIACRDPQRAKEKAAEYGFNGITFITYKEVFGHYFDSPLYIDELEKFAKDANLLICESTFLKGQIRNGDNHLFAHEAAIIAKNANADDEEPTDSVDFYLFKDMQPVVDWAKWDLSVLGKVAKVHNYFLYKK